MIFYSFLKGNLSWRKWSALLTKFSGWERKRGLDIVERGRVLKRHGLFFYSPSQTGKASGLKYLCRTDRVDYSLGFIYGSASEARLYGVLIKELIDKKAYLGIFAALRKQQAKTFTTAAMLRELHLIPWLRQDLLLRSKVNTLKPAFGWRKGKPCNLVPPLKKEAFDGSPFWIAFLFFEFLFPISFSIFLFLSLSYICL